MGKGKKWKEFLANLRPDRTDSKQVKTVERIAAINHSTEAVGWRPVGYTIPEHFEKFLQNLEADVEDLISKANPDMYNPRFYDKTVDIEVEIAKKELAGQRIEHERSIHNIRIYQQASLADIENHLHRVEEARSKNAI